MEESMEKNSEQIHEDVCRSHERRRIGLFRTTVNGEKTFDIVKFLENEWFVIRIFKRSRNAIEAYKALTKPEIERSEDDECPY